MNPMIVRSPNDSSYGIVGIKKLFCLVDVVSREYSIAILWNSEAPSTDGMLIGTVVVVLST